MQHCALLAPHQIEPYSCYWQFQACGRGYLPHSSDQLACATATETAADRRQSPEIAKTY
jgi:hypothetical protein